MLSRLMAAPAMAGRLQPLTVVDVPMHDVYPPDHWAIDRPAAGLRHARRRRLLIGRNITLLAKAGIVAARAEARRIALGPLAGNPFPDATPAFFAAMAEALSRGLAHALTIVTPFAALQKPQVIELGARLGVPFELTLSCMNPEGDAHCGAVQQVPRAARGVRRGRRARPERLRAARAVGRAPAAPLRTRSESCRRPCARAGCGRRRRAWP